MLKSKEVVDWYGFKVFECNAPVSRPGVYVITHVASGQQYVGLSCDIAHRVPQHLTFMSGASKLRKAISDEGNSGFLVTPVFYSLSGVDGLEHVKAQIIAALDSVRSGYNVVAADRGAGPYGDEFAEFVKKGLATPEAKRRRAKILASAAASEKRGKAISAAFARPEVKAKLKARPRPNVAELSKTPEAIVKRMATEAHPETKARRSAAVKAMHANPENKANHVRACVEAAMKPERRAEIARMRRGRVWITDGVSLRAILATDVIPEGWRRGWRRKL